MAINRTAFIVLVLTLILTKAAGAQAPMTMDAAVARALGANAGLGRAALDLASAKRAAEASGNLFYPRVSLSGSLSRTGLLADSLDPELDNYTVSAGLDLSLSLSPAIKVKAERLKLVYEGACISYEQVERALELEVRSSFYTLLLDREKHSLAEQNLEREGRRCAQVQVKYAAGLLPELDYLTAQVSLAEMEPKVESARATLENDLDSFRLLLGLEPGSALEVEGSLGTARTGTSDAAWEGAVAAKGESLEVAALLNSLEIAQVDRTLASLGLSSPSLSLGASIVPTRGLGSAAVLSDTGAFSATLSLPLGGYLPSSSERIALADAEDCIASLESKLAEAERDSKTAVAGYLRSIKTSSASLAAFGRNVELAQKAYDLTSQAYDKGLRNLSDVETAAGNLDSAKADFVSAEYTLLSNALKLENELGLAFGTIGRN